MTTLQSRHRTKRCPFCAETIRYEAVKCRFCGEFLRGDRIHSCPEPAWEDPEPTAEDTDAEEAEEAPDEAEVEEARAEEGDEDDAVLYAGRPSLFALTGPLLVSLAVVTACGAVYYRPVAQYLLLVPRVRLSVEQLVQIELVVDWGALGLALLVGLRALYRAALLKSTYYEVTPDRIEWSRGIFDRRVDNLDMYRIIDLKLRRSLWDCLVGIGTVILTTKDDSDPTFTFHKVRQCRYLYDVLKKAGLEADRQRGVIHIE